MAMIGVGEATADRGANIGAGFVWMAAGAGFILGAVCTALAWTKPLSPTLRSTCAVSSIILVLLAVLAVVGSQFNW